MRNLFFAIAILLNFGAFCVLGKNTEQRIDPNGSLNKFHHLATSNEFTLGAVTSIVQDQKGLMWFGTRQGLMIYDGTEFRRFKAINDQLEKRNQYDIAQLIVDKRGLLWLGTADGVVVVDPQTLKILSITEEESSPDYLNSPVNCIFELFSGAILLGLNSGLYEYSPIDQIVRLISMDAEGIGVESNEVLSIYQSSDSLIWVGTDVGLFKSLTKQLSDGFELYRYIEPDPSSIVNNEIHALAEDNSGNILIGTRTGLDLLENKKPPFIHISKSRYNLSHEYIRTIAIDDDNNIWVGTYDGITVLGPKGGQEIIVHHSQRPNSIKDNKIRSLYKDNSGGIWVGTYYGGVNYWNPQNFNFGHLDDSGELRLSYNVVSALAIENHGNIIIGTEGRGICVFDESLNKITNIEKLKDNSNIGSVKALLVNKDVCWIGTFNNGLIKFNLTNHTSEQFRNDESNIYSLPNNRVISLALVNNDLICAGTIGGGLSLLETKTGKFKNFSIADGLPGTTIRSIAVDNNGNLWIGTENGMSMLSATNLRNGQYNFEILEVEGIQDTQLYTNHVFVDRADRIWVGTTNHGLFKYENKKLRQLNAVPVSSVLSISDDAQGMLWVSTDLGLVRYNPASGEMKVFNQNHGLTSNEFTKGAALCSRSGVVYFGGASGLTFFNPVSLSLTDTLNPPVVLTHFKLNDHEVLPGDSSGILTKSITYAEHIRLKYNQSNFTLQFAHPVFKQQRNFAYQYKLSGINDDWISTSNLIATYNIQRGGNYIFEVRAVNTETNNLSPVTTIHIEMLSAPWRTWWAFLLYGMIISASLLGLIFVIQTQTRLKHNLELEKQAHEHQQEINENKLRFFTNISHEFRTPLTLILGPLEQIIRDYKGSRNVFRNLKIIQKNADHLYRLISELMVFRKLDKHQMKLKVQSADIISYVYEIYLSFEPKAKLHKYNYTFDTSEKLIYVSIDKDKLERVFFNLLSNAFKYTNNGGKINVHICREIDKIKISVQDDGCGIQPQHLDYIFDRFYEIRNEAEQGSYQQGTGIGLTIARNITELHNGSIEVESIPGQGSCFTVRLPIVDIQEVPRKSEDFEPSHAPLQEQVDFKDRESLNMLFSKAADQQASSIKILIVEDDPEMRDFLNEVLSSFYQVNCKENGAKAFDYALVNQPELIISDVMMPVMDGIEFCQKIKSTIETSHIPFIMLTARSSVLHKFEGLQSGADEYLSKPFAVKELLLKCQNILKTRQNLKATFEKSGKVSLPMINMNSMDEELMKKAIEIVQQNLSNEFFDIMEFCEQLGVSRTVLFSKIKNWTQMTPNDFINTLRMKKAAELIERRVGTISQVAYEVGFKDPKYFSKCFNKRFGMSPKEYKSRFQV